MHRIICYFMINYNGILNKNIRIKNYYIYYRLVYILDYATMIRNRIYVTFLIIV